MSKPKKGKRFVYSLATILKVREIREIQQKDKYNQAQKQVDIEIQKEEQLKQDQLSQYAEIRSIISEGKMEKLYQIKIRQLLIEDLNVKIEEQKKVVEAAKEKVEEELQNLIKAVKDKKIIEKDREKTKEAWRKLMDKEEGKFLDEVSSVGFDRKAKAKIEEDEATAKKNKKDI